MQMIQVPYVFVGLEPSWYIQHVVVWDSQTDHMFFFLLEDWLSVDYHKNSTVEKEVLASCKLLHPAVEDILSSHNNKTLLSFEYKQFVLFISSAFSSPLKRCVWQNSISWWKYFHGDDNEVYVRFFHGWTLIFVDKCNISFLNWVWFVNRSPRTGPEELSEFRRVFTSQLLFGVFEHHLWVSLWEHPATSCFTRSQRVTCSALVLHLYLALCALWYGAVGTKLQG